MIADVENEKLDFLQPIESISEDSIADLVGGYIFRDLLSAAQMPIAKDEMQAHTRGIPEPQKQPQDDSFAMGRFSEL